MFLRTSKFKLPRDFLDVFVFRTSTGSKFGQVNCCLAYCLVRVRQPLTSGFSSNLVMEGLLHVVSPVTLEAPN